MSSQEFCRLLKTVKVDVDSSGKKCKERMMKVLIETPLASSIGHGYRSHTHTHTVDIRTGPECLITAVFLLLSHNFSLFLSISLPGFVVKNCQSLAELTTAFQEFNMTRLYQQILPSLSD